MSKPLILLVVSAALIVAAASPAAAVRPECEQIPPPGPSVCFIEEPFLGVFYEEPLDDPQEMVLLLINDREDDFVLSFPDGSLFVHTPERSGAMFWCPFPFAEFDFGNTQPECVFGTARLQSNGYIELSGDFGCPFTSHLSGSGVRGTDAAPFDVDSDLIIVPDPREPSGCRVVTNEITATPAP